MAKIFHDHIISGKQARTLPPYRERQAGIPTEAQLHLLALPQCLSWRYTAPDHVDACGRTYSYGGYCPANDV